MQTNSSESTKERTFNALESEDIMVGIYGQDTSFELDLKNEQAFAKPRKHCKSGVGNSRKIRMKQNKTDARQDDKDRGART